MRLNKLWILIVFLTLSESACAIPRSDVLECGLPDGSKFIRTSKYDWNPININPHGSSKHHRRAEPTKFKPHGSWRSIELPGVGVPDSLDVNERYCFAYGIKNNTAYEAINFYYDFSNKKHYEVGFDSKFDIPGPLVDRPKQLQKQFDEMQLDPLPGYAGLTVVSNVIYKEQMLTKAVGDIIAAVWQSTSADGGKTWSDPIITRDAKIFELGKTIYEQSFIARPISINGKKIEAHFP